MSSSFRTVGLRAFSRSLVQRQAPLQRRSVSRLAAAPKENYQRFQSSYKSPYGPEYKIAPNIEGWTLGSVTKIAFYGSGFLAALGVGAIFFFGEVPRVRKDIMSKLPIIGGYWVREIPPEDNPF